MKDGNNLKVISSMYYAVMNMVGIKLDNIVIERFSYGNSTL